MASFSKVSIWKATDGIYQRKSSFISIQYEKQEKWKWNAINPFSEYYATDIDYKY